jgi:hypothetical protein
MEQPRIGNWLQTFSGKAVYPLDLRPEDIDIVDIAHALSNICRYNGHSKVFYCVAEHSYFISCHVPLPYALWGLLHDASEAYLADVPRPVKPFLPGYKQIEAQVQKVIIEKYGLNLPEPTAVKDIDDRILANEKAAFMNESVIPWGFLPEPIEGLNLEGWPPPVAKQKFLERFFVLTGHV